MIFLDATWFSFTSRLGAIIPDGATFNGNPNVLPPDYIATLNVGDVLDNDDLNPLLWRSAGGPPRL